MIRLAMTTGYLLIASTDTSGSRLSVVPTCRESLKQARRGSPIRKMCGRRLGPRQASRSKPVSTVLGQGIEEQGNSRNSRMELRTDNGKPHRRKTPPGLPGSQVVRDAFFQFGFKLLTHL